MPSGRAASRHCFCISSARHGVVPAGPDARPRSLGGQRQSIQTRWGGPGDIWRRLIDIRGDLPLAILFFIDQ